ncbi:hypothetical protein HJ01_01599 [Flavobacterium frigoris PS1]|uniref:Uncharacterized protein n=1 Tax=Flavobacterium frigoris (strain PS1) TaxID=1086011 RepID=H7FR50_FLAFP|nr:hypothetical protein HJ01_01599 [Flavobacterium frigoris PS1]
MNNLFPEKSDKLDFVFKSNLKINLLLFMYLGGNLKQH